MGSRSWHYKRKGLGLRTEELEASLTGALTAADTAEIENSSFEPVEIDAGGPLEIMGTIACVPPCDLRGSMVAITDQDGSVVGEAEIVDFDGEVNTTREVVVKAPLQAGTHEWKAVLPAHTSGGVDYDEASTALSIIVKAHQVSVVVWDVPSAISSGETFRFKVGVKCTSECRPTGWTFEVNDGLGNQVAAGVPGDEPWPGTAALFYAEVEAKAPVAEGLHDWTVSAPGPNSDIPHEQHKTRFGVRAVRQPQCVITVEAIDGESQLPIKGAKVVVHPYRVVTDESGRAQVRVPKGAYRIFVSGAQHIPYRAEYEVQDDLSVRAELVVDRAPTDADLWS